MRYSSLLGGSDIDEGHAIALDGQYNVYITGLTRSTDFPISGSVPQSSLAGTTSCPGTRYCFDAFVTKLNAAGSAWSYSTYLGGADNDYGYGIAVDAGGAAYVTGETWSSNFITTTGVFQPLAANLPDAFVSKLNASGTQWRYSSCLGGNYGEHGSAIAVERGGEAVVVGTTDSSDFPLSADALQGNQTGLDAFVMRVTLTGSARRYSSYLGGNGSDEGNGLALDRAGSAYLTGSSTSSDFPTHQALQASTGGASDAFVSVIGAVLPTDQEWTQGCDCDAQHDAEQPVNTRSGNYWTRVSDLAPATSGPALVWTRTYASQAITATLSGLSEGWQQPYATRVITPGAPGGEAGTVSVLAPELNRLRFRDLGGGQYAAWAGVYSTLVQANGLYTQTLRTQEQHISRRVGG